MANQKYFFCDLDGTFIKEDMLLLSTMMLVKENPWKFMLILFTFWRGLPWAKDSIASSINIKKLDFSISKNVLKLIKLKKAEGYICCLISGSNHNLVKEVFQKHKLFDDYYGSNAKVNLVGKHKLKKIKELTSDFEYIGNSRQDIPIWRHANKAYIYSTSKKFVERVVLLLPGAIKVKAD